MIMRGNHINREVTKNMRPLELTPWETSECLMKLIENDATTPRLSKLKEDVQRNALKHDILLGFYP